MALRVWLPLNGDLENKGISNVTVTNNGATVDNNGKIGKCYYFNGSTYINGSGINYTSLSTHFSISLWVKIYELVPSYTEILSLAPSAGWAKIRFGMVIPSNSNVISCSVADGTNYLGNSFQTSQIPLNMWTHICFIYNNKNLELYINGNFLKSYSTNIIPDWENISTIGIGAAANGGEKSKSYINDVRIYDHCLSPKEVKEISQGLVLHYKLDGFSGGSGRNLALKSTNGHFGSTNTLETLTFSGWDNYAQYNINLTAEKWNNLVGQKITYTCYINNIEQTVGTGTGIMIHFRYADGTYTQYGGGKNGVTNSWFAQGESGLARLTVTVPDPTTRTNPTTITHVQYSVRHNSSTGVGTVEYKHAQVEIGDTPTAWSWAPEDLGIDTTKIIDSSGYENDGTIAGNLVIEKNSDRYNISTYFDGNSYISTVPGDFNWFDFSECTIAAWLKPTASMTGWRGSIGIQQDGSQTIKGFSLTDYSNELRAVVVNGSYTTISSGKTLPIGEWHHCAVTLNGTELKQYYDGVLIKTSTISWGTATAPTLARFAVGVDFPGTDEKFTGNYSDIRFYTTALSTEDIADLYHTPASIDNLGGIHGFEFAEDGEKDSIYKNGIISNSHNINYLVNNFSETNTTTDWTFGGTNSISNGIVTLEGSGTGPNITSKTFNVGVNDIIVIEIGVQLPTTSTKTSGGGIYLGTKFGQSTSLFGYNFTTNTWTTSSTNNTNPYFINGYNSTDYYHCRTYLLGSNKTIDDIPIPEATNTRALYAIKLNSDTTTNIRSGYNSGNSAMVIKLSNFKIYNLTQHGIVEINNSAKTGLGYLQYSNFIEK